MGLYVRVEGRRPNSWRSDERAKEGTTRCGNAMSTGPHVPLTTSAGHFLSMQPATDAKAPRDAVWYRGDEWDIVAAESARYLAALRAVIARYDAEDLEILDFLDIAERALK